MGKTLVSRYSEMLSGYSDLVSRYSEMLSRYSEIIYIYTTSFQGHRREANNYWQFNNPSWRKSRYYHHTITCDVETDNVGRKCTCFFVNMTRSQWCPHVNHTGPNIIIAAPTGFNCILSQFVAMETDGPGDRCVSFSSGGDCLSLDCHLSRATYARDTITGPLCNGIWLTRRGLLNHTSGLIISHSIGDVQNTIDHQWVRAQGGNSIHTEMAYLKYSTDRSTAGRTLLALSFIQRYQI